MTHHMHMTEEMKKCIQNCLDCYRACLETVMHCVTKGGKHAMPKHVRLLMECANICNTSANFMLVGSENHASVCEVCADICDQCAEECEEMADDAEMKACAEICRRCAESCRQMAGANV